MQANDGPHLARFHSHLHVGSSPYSSISGHICNGIESMVQVMGLNGEKCSRDDSQGRAAVFEGGREGGRERGREREREREREVNRRAP